MAYRARLFIFCFLGALITGSVATGRIVSESEVDFTQNKGTKPSLNLQEVDRLYRMRQQRIKEIYNPKNFVPDDIKETDSGSRAGLKILGKTLEHLVDESQLKQSALGATAQRLNRGLASEMEVSSKEGEVKHSFKMELKAAQTRASIRYKGYADAALTYEMDNQAVRLQVSEKLFNNISLVFTHLESPVELRDEISLNYTW